MSTSVRSGGIFTVLMSLVSSFGPSSTTRARTTGRNLHDVYSRGGNTLAMKKLSQNGGLGMNMSGILRREFEMFGNRLHRNRLEHCIRTLE